MTPSGNSHQDEFVIRVASPQDSATIDSLLESGLLPGHVDYEAERSERITPSLGSKRESFFVAEARGRIIGSIAVIEAKPDVGHLHWLRVAPQWQPNLKVARALVAAAAEHARTVGLLKLAMHAPAEVEQLVSDYYRELGFLFSRTRDVGGLHVLEFYLNLYESPKAPEGNEAAD